MRSRLTCAIVLMFCSLVPAAAPPTCVDAREVEVLVRMLDDDNFHTRERADVALRAMGRPVLPHLRAEHGRTPSREVRDRIASMVRDLTVDERIGQLVTMLGDGDALTRARADYALRHAGVGVVPLLREAQPTLDRDQRARVERIIADLEPRR